MKQVIATWTIVVATAALTGCGTLSKESDAVPINELRGVRVDLRAQCLVATDYEGALKRERADPGKPKGAEAGILAGLVGSLAPSIFNKLVGLAAAYAEKVGKEYSATSTGATAVTLSGEDVRGCITYVAGRFGDATPSSDGSWSQQSLAALGLVRRPDVYAEFVLHSVDADGKHVAITPVHLEFNAPQSKRTSSGKTKDLSFIVELGAPSNAVAAVSIVRPAARPAIAGTDEKKPEPPKEADKDSSSKGTALATFPLTFGAVAVGSRFKMGSIQGAKTQSQVLDKGLRSANVAVTAIETEGGGDFFLHLSSFIDENKQTFVDTGTSAVKNLLGTSEKK